MSILIKGMEMPKNCRQCSLYLQSMDSERNVYENCAVTAKSYNWGLTTRPSDCPLVPVPEHGDLIDRDAYEKLLRGLGSRDYRREKGTISDAIKFLHPHYTPTIIQAEEGE